MTEDTAHYRWTGGKKKADIVGRVSSQRPVENVRGHTSVAMSSPAVSTGPLPSSPLPQNVFCLRPLLFWL